MNQTIVQRNNWISQQFIRKYNFLILCPGFIVLICLCNAIRSSKHIPWHLIVGTYSTAIQLQHTRLQFKLLTLAANLFVKHRKGKMAARFLSICVCKLFIFLCDKAISSAKAFIKPANCCLNESSIKKFALITEPRVTTGALSGWVQ